MENKINGLRFIVGSECNYNCFYCHKEGFCESKYIEIDDDKLEKLYQISFISSTTILRPQKLQMTRVSRLKPRPVAHL